MSAESTDNTKRVKKCQIYKNVVPFLQNYVFCLADSEILLIFAVGHGETWLRLGNWSKLHCSRLARALRQQSISINFLNNDNYGRRFKEKTERGAASGRAAR